MEGLGNVLEVLSLVLEAACGPEFTGVVGAELKLAESDGLGRSIPLGLEFLEIDPLGEDSRLSNSDKWSGESKGVLAGGDGDVAVLLEAFEDGGIGNVVDVVGEIEIPS